MVHSVAGTAALGCICCAVCALAPPCVQEQYAAGAKELSPSVRYNLCAVMVERVGFLSQARQVRPSVVPGRCARSRWRLSPTRRLLPVSMITVPGMTARRWRLCCDTPSPVDRCINRGRRRLRSHRCSGAIEAPETAAGQRPRALACSCSCGRDRRRSGDLPLFRRSLCRLSYPTVDCHRLPDDGHADLEGEHASAVPTGFEPATSALTGRRALQTAPRDQLGGRTRGPVPMSAR